MLILIPIMRSSALLTAILTTTTITTILLASLTFTTTTTTAFPIPISSFSPADHFKVAVAQQRARRQEFKEWVSVAEEKRAYLLEMVGGDGF